MALDPRDFLTEDLFEPTKVYLFGKKFKGLNFDLSALGRTPCHAPKTADDFQMPPPNLETALRRKMYGAQSGEADGVREQEDFLEPLLARIYSFSYEGLYHKLPRPTIYLVWGKGVHPEQQSTESGAPPFQTVDTGMEGKDFRFASDIRAWKMDRLDVSIAIDLEIGNLEGILLAPVFSMEEMASGADGSRMAMASRMAMNSRMAMTSRMAMAGPHQK